jgi:hypothetical protein
LSAIPSSPTNAVNIMCSPGDDVGIVGEGRECSMYLTEILWYPLFGYMVWQVWFVGHTHTGRLYTGRTKDNWCNTRVGHPAPPCYPQFPQVPRRMCRSHPHTLPSSPPPLPSQRRDIISSPGCSPQTRQ